MSLGKSPLLSPLFYLHRKRSISGLQGGHSIAFLGWAAQDSTGRCCFPPSCQVKMNEAGSAGEDPRTGLESQSHASLSVFITISQY